MANLAMPALLGLASYMSRNKEQPEQAASNKTDMNPMIGANQDDEDMARGQAMGAATAAPAMRADQNQSQAEINRLMNAPATGVPTVMTMKNPSFKQAFAEARLAGDKTFQWNGKTYTTEMAGKTTPAQKTTNDPGVVQRFIASQSAPNQSDAETKRLQAQNTKAANYTPKSDYGTDIDYGLYASKLPRNKDDKVDIDQFINNIKKQDKAEGISRTPEQYDAIKKITLKKYSNDFIQGAQPKAEPQKEKTKKTYVDKFGDGKVHTYEEKPEEEASTTRHARTGRTYAKGGAVKAFAKGGRVSASSRADGLAKKGHTKGRIV
jgi:hypothetical protein